MKSQLSFQGVVCWYDLFMLVWFIQTIQRCRGCWLLAKRKKSKKEKNQKKKKEKKKNNIKIQIRGVAGVDNGKYGNIL